MNFQFIAKVRLVFDQRSNERRFFAQSLVEDVWKSELERRDQILHGKVLGSGEEEREEEERNREMERGEDEGRLCQQVGSDEDEAEENDERKREERDRKCSPSGEERDTKNETKFKEF